MTTQLYNNANTPIYPVTEASVVSTSINGQSVEDNLVLHADKISKLESLVSGASAVENALTIDVSYARNTDKDTPPTSEWSEVLDLPDTENPFTWKQTVYNWYNKPVNTTKEIVLTAQFPETQFLFCATGTTNQIGGPNGYPTEGDNVKDKTAEDLYWYTSPQDVSISQPYSYMATRTRAANQNWTTADGEEIEFKWAVIGRFAFDSVPQTRYCITTTSDIPNYESNSNGNFDYDPNRTWKSSLSLDDYSGLESYYVWETHGFSINGTLQKVSDKYWSTPSLIAMK